MASRAPLIAVSSIACLIPLISAASPPAAADPAACASLIDFAAFEAAYRGAVPGARAGILDAYVACQEARGGFPVTESGRDAVFLHRGDGIESEARVIGEFKPTSFYSFQWDPAGIPLLPIAEKSPARFARVPVKPDARLEYQFVLDGKTKIVDPLNPRRAFNGPAGGDASEFAMPGHPASAASAELPESARGTTHSLREDWFLAPIRVHLPAGYDAARKYPVVYTADGGAWEKHMGLPESLDRLTAEGKLAPAIAVMIDPIADRSTWYLFNRAYLEYLEKIVRYVDSKYATRVDPRHRLHLGSSAGGRAALFAGLERPDLFANVAMFSPSLSGSLAYFEPYLTRRARPPRGLRAWISAGHYEGSLEQDAKLMEKALRSGGAKVDSAYTSEGHSFQAWKRLSREALIRFFPARKPGTH